MCHKAYGRPGFIFAAFVSFFFNWGGFIGNLISLPSILNSFIKGAVDKSINVDRKVALPILGMLFLPLAFYKGISKISLLSAMCSASLWVCILTVFSKALVTHAFSTAAFDAAPAGAWDFLHKDWIPSIGGMVYVYTCHDMAFHVSHSLENPTSSRVNAVALFSNVSMMIAATLIGVSGYCLFYDGVADNILDNFPDHDVAVNVARLMVVVTVAVGVPYSLYLPRAALNSVIQLFHPDLVNTTLKAGAAGFKRRLLHVCITVLELVVAILIAMYITDLGPAYELVGVCGMFLSFVLPALCAWKLGGSATWRIPGDLFFLLVFGLLAQVAIMMSLFL
jgi:amino acid permease